MRPAAVMTAITVDVVQPSAEGNGPSSPERRPVMWTSTYPQTTDVKKKQEG